MINLKQNLLSLGFFVDNKYLDFYCTLIQENLTTPETKGLTEKHHIIQRKIYTILNNDNVDYYIEYKFIEKNKVHRISFGYKDLVFIFDIKWIGNSLSIVGWDLVNGDDYEQQYKGFEEIDCAIDDDEEE